MFRDFKKYEVFDDGRVWSHYKNGFLKPSPNENGYLMVGLSDNNNIQKTYKVHRVVYEAVTGQPIPEDKEVNHIDENKNNNAFSNLNLLTRKENVNWGTRNERAGKSRINHPMRSKQVIQYDNENNPINIFPSLSEVERKYGFSASKICACCRGKRKQAYGFIWRYAS